MDKPTFTPLRMALAKKFNSDAEAARATGFNAKTVRRYAAGDASKISARALARFAQALEISTAEAETLIRESGNGGRAA